MLKNSLSKYYFFKCHLIIGGIFIFISLNLPCYPTNKVVIKINPNYSSQIIDYTLFSFDNIVADYFESGEDRYINQLVLLIQRGTDLPYDSINNIILSHPITYEDTPPSYMLSLNKRLMNLTGFFYRCR